MANTTTSSPRAFCIGDGWKQQAIYQESPIRKYQGNPFIAALPSILTLEQAATRLAVDPGFDASERELSRELRIQCMLTATEFVQPLPSHLDLETRISTAIRQGYVARNPLDQAYWHDAKNANASPLETNARIVKSTYPGFNIIAVSGIGKTTAIQTILSKLYPQVIYHNEYQGQPFIFTQVVWLKLECPSRGAMGNLCMDFYSQIDDLLDTHFVANYAGNGRAVGAMVNNMKYAARAIGLGVLVIDEVQRLAGANPALQSEVANTLVALVNQVGLPVIFVGTPLAQKVVSREFRQARRGTGQGDMILSPMQFYKPQEKGQEVEMDETWKLFVEAMWRYMYLQKGPFEATHELSKRIWDESQGVTDIAVKLFCLAQMRALVNGREVLEAKDITSVAADSLVSVRPMLDALRSGNKTDLTKFDDLGPIDMKPSVDAALQRLRLDELKKGQQTRTGALATAHTSVPGSKRAEAPTAKGNSSPGRKPVSRPKSRKSNSNQAVTAAPEGILATALKAAERKIDAYEALKQAGYIRGAEEFLSIEGDA